MDLEPSPASVVVDIPVAWGDMDSYGHVNNTIFLRWCETARIAHFEQTQVTARMKSEGMGPILARVALDFRRPVLFPDTIRASAWVTRVGHSSFVLAYRLYSLKQNAVVGEGDSVIVMLDYRRGVKVAIDEPLRERLSAPSHHSP